MTKNEQQAMLRKYAAGEITWSSLRSRGIESYLDVLIGLGEMSLRPPVAPMEGSNAEARRRGREIIRHALAMKPG